MKREITINSVSFSTLIPGMQSGRYDFIAAPTTVTKERAEQMLFTAGYLWTAFQFGIKKGSAPIKGWEDLKGKAVPSTRARPTRRSASRRARRSASRSRPTTPSPTPCRRCCPAAPTPRSAATPSIVYTALEEPAVRGRPRAHGDARPLGGADPQGQVPAARPAAGCARLHEEGRHAADASTRSGSRKKPAAGRSRRGDHAGLRRAGHAGLRSDAARAALRRDAADRLAPRPSTSTSAPFTS